MNHQGGEYAACTGKKQYPSEGKARAALCQIQKRRGYKGGNAYLCIFCFFWHVGRRSRVYRKGKWRSRK